jgi:hypothetical protein
MEDVGGIFGGRNREEEETEKLLGFVPKELMIDSQACKEEKARKREALPHKYGGLHSRQRLGERPFLEQEFKSLLWCFKQVSGCFGDVNVQCRTTVA